MSELVEILNKELHTGITEKVDWKTLFNEKDSRLDLGQRDVTKHFQISNLENSPFINSTNKPETLDGWEKKGFLLNERWDNIFNIQSRVIQISKNEIVCECIIDPETNHFEKRIFDRILFDNLPNLEVGTFVLLSIQTKKGSSRIDIYKGDGIVDKSKFNLLEQLKSLEGFGLDKSVIYD